MNNKIEIFRIISRTYDNGSDIYDNNDDDDDILIINSFEIDTFTIN